MKHWLNWLILVALMASFAGPLMAQDTPPELPALDDLRRGWSVIEPGGESVCARGTPYQFMVRKTDATEKLMIYFQGGGACWNALTCRVGGTFDDSVNGYSGEIYGYNGIFDFRAESNPVRDYNIVFVPVCTGDVHIGDAEVSFNEALSINFNGANNTRTVLDWTFANFPDVSQILIAGTSAGAYGAIYWTPTIAENYSDARIVQLGDAGVGASPAGWSVTRLWDIYANMYDFGGAIDINPDTFRLNDLYVGASQLFPNLTLSQYTTAYDDVQTNFYNFTGEAEEPFYDVLRENLTTLEENVPNFTSYLAPGELHTILPRPEFYTLTVNGVKFVDWFTALVNGTLPETVACEVCEE